MISMRPSTAAPTTSGIGMTIGEMIAIFGRGWLFFIEIYYILKSMVKVSIVIPVYNVADYMKECFESVAGQTMGDFEAILIDDGATDNSGKICDEWVKKDKRFKVIHQKNAGVSAARNRGLKSAKGEYVAFVDSDDAIGKHYLERLVAAATQHNADIVVSPIIKFTDKVHKEVLDREVLEVSVEDAATNLLYGKNEAYWGGPGAKLYKREMVIGRQFRADLRYSEDVDFFYKAIMDAKKIVAISYAGYMYRIRPGSATQAGFKPAFMDYRLEWDALDKSGLSKRVRKAWESNIVFNMLYYLSVMDVQADQESWEKAWGVIKRDRVKVVLNFEQKWDQKLAILGTFLGAKFAANTLRRARDGRIEKAA